MITNKNQGLIMQNCEHVMNRAILPGAEAARGKMEVEDVQIVLKSCFAAISLSSLGTCVPRSTWQITLYKTLKPQQNTWIRVTGTPETEQMCTSILGSIFC